MSDFYADGCVVQMAGKMADPEMGAMKTPQLAARTADALGLVDEASDTELRLLRESGVFADLVKAWRKENARLLAALADEAAGDAAFKLRPALATE